MDEHAEWEIQTNSVNIVDDPALEEGIRNILLPIKVDETYIPFLNETANGVKMVDGRVPIFGVLMPQKIQVG